MSSPINAHFLQAAQDIALDAANRAADLINEAYALRNRVSETKAEQRLAARRGGASSLVSSSPSESSTFDLGLDTKNTSTDLVTKYDKACEDIIISKLKSFSHPSTPTVEWANRSLPIIGEESANDVVLTDAPTWIVDPIDGTTAFVHGSFDCCVSIGLCVNKRPVMGVVVAPRLRETFTAMEGHGAYCNGRLINVSDVTEPSRAVYVAHYPYGRTPKLIGAVTDMLTSLAREHRVHGIRCYASAAIDMCGVACGRNDCYFECGVQSWDMAASTIIVREAGGVVMDLDGGELTDINRRGMSCAASKPLAEVGITLAKKNNYRNALLSKL